MIDLNDTTGQGELRFHTRVGTSLVERGGFNGTNFFVGSSIGVASLKSMSGGIAIRNAGAVPTEGTNNMGFLYLQNGDLKYMSEADVITVIANDATGDRWHTTEIDTGIKLNGATLYMKSFSGTVPSGIADLISGGIAKVWHVEGWVNNGSVRNIPFGSGFHDGTNTVYVFRDTGTSDLSMFGAGAFVGEDYEVTIWYTKT
jgi:hypothetical protein